MRVHFLTKAKQRGLSKVNRRFLLFCLPGQPSSSSPISSSSSQKWQRSALKNKNWLECNIPLLCLKQKRSIVHDGWFSMNVSVVSSYTQTVAMKQLWRFRFPHKRKAHNGHVGVPLKGEVCGGGVKHQKVQRLLIFYGGAWITMTKQVIDRPWWLCKTDILTT